MEIGIIFFSQAVNTQEAVAEAEFVINNLEGYEISYPIAFDMEYIPNDESRIDTLDEEQKTRIAEAFLDRIESEGYRGILYGNKSWLLTELVRISCFWNMTCCFPIRNRCPIILMSSKCGNTQ